MHTLAAFIINSGHSSFQSPGARAQGNSLHPKNTDISSLNLDNIEESNNLPGIADTENVVKKRRIRKNTT